MYKHATYKQLIYRNDLSPPSSLTVNVRTTMPSVLPSAPTRKEMNTLVWPGFSSLQLPLLMPWRLPPHLSWAHSPPSRVWHLHIPTAAPWEPWVPWASLQFHSTPTWEFWGWGRTYLESWVVTWKFSHNSNDKIVPIFQIWQGIKKFVYQLNILFLLGNDSQFFNSTLYS